jgi:hypothetical protein
MNSFKLQAERERINSKVEEILEELEEIPEDYLGNALDFVLAMRDRFNDGQDFSEKMLIGLENVLSCANLKIDRENR